MTTNNAPALTGVIPDLPGNSEDALFHLISYSQILAGFTDADGDQLFVTDANVDRGTLSAGELGGGLVYIPLKDYYGTVTINYFVTDGRGGRTAATQSFFLQPVNDNPALTGNQATLPSGIEDTPYTLDSALLVQGITDVDDDPLSVSIVNGNANLAKITKNVDGTFTITPAEDFNGILDLNFGVTDGKDGIVYAKQSVSFAAINDAPIFAAADGMSRSYTHINNGLARVSLALMPDGRILSAGTDSAPSDGRLPRYQIIAHSLDGSYAELFDGANALEVDIGLQVTTKDIALSEDGTIVLGGIVFDTPNYTGRDFGLVRIAGDGAIDAYVIPVDSFDGADDLSAIALQPDGKILATGTIDNFFSSPDLGLIRLDADGHLDSTFGGDGKVVLNIGPIDAWNTAEDVALQSDGKIIVAGVADRDAYVVRFRHDGSLDVEFGVEGIFTDTSHDRWYGFASAQLAIQPDGKILLTGQSSAHTTDNYVKSSFNVTRINSDGSLDHGFGIHGTQLIDASQGGNEVHCIALQTDGKILLGGTSFQADGWNYGPRTLTIVRLNSDGSLDTSFSGDGKVFIPIANHEATANSISLQPDGKIVIGANVYGNGGLSGEYIIRLNGDGSPDTTFGDNALNGIATYYRGGPPVNLDVDVQITDVELDQTNNFNGATLVLTRQGGADVKDRFFGGGIVTFDKGRVWIAGTDVGGVETDSGVLTVSFNTNATIEGVEQVLRSISYAMVGHGPEETIHISWTLDDGNTGNQGFGGSRSGSGTSTVVVKPLDESPLGGNANITINDLESPATLTAASFGNFFEFHGGTNLTQVRIDTLPTSGTLLYLGSPVTSGMIVSAEGLAAGHLTYLVFPDASAGEYATFQFSVGDSKGQFSHASYQLAVNIELPASNSAPSGVVIVQGIAIQGEVLSASHLLSDADGLGVVQYRWQSSDDGGQTWFELTQGATLTLSQDQVGKVLRTIASYTDGLGHNEAIASNATAQIANINDAPKAGNIRPQYAMRTTELTLDLASIFNDADGDVLTFTASGLPTQLTIDSETGVINGIVPAPMGTHQVTATATDPYGATATLVFDLVIVGGNPVSNDVRTRSAERLPGVSTVELFSATPEGSLYGFKNFSIEMNPDTNVKTIRADLVATGTGTEHEIEFSLLESGGATLVEFVRAEIFGSTSGWNLSETKFAGGYQLTASNDGSEVGANVVLGTLTVLVPGDVISEKILSLRNANLGGETAPVRDLFFREYTSNQSSAIDGAFANGNLAIFVHRENEDHLVTGTSRPITAADALQALRISVGLPTVAGLPPSWQELVAADVDRNGKVNASDALEILKSSVGVGKIEPTWVFAAPEVFLQSTMNRNNVSYKDEWSLESITTQTNLGFTAILLGDVNNSWTIPQ